MRITRTYSIDEDLLKLLQHEKNMSDLINELLTEYFKKKYLNNPEFYALVKDRPAINVEKLEGENNG